MSPLEAEILTRRHEELVTHRDILLKVANTTGMDRDWNEYLTAKGYVLGLDWALKHLKEYGGQPNL
jgi:hypothetical protein